MTVKARSTLQTQATQVRDETSTAANTATRVGTMFLDLVDSVVLKSEEFTRVETIAVTNVASLSGPQTVNGISLIDGDPVLLNAQTVGTEGGPWIVKTGAWERPAGMTIIKPGAVFYVERGTVHADTRWYLTNDADVTLDTGSPTFSQGDVRTFTHDGIAATFVSAVNLENNTAATVGVPDQRSPGMHFKSHVYQSAVDHDIDVVQYAGKLVFGWGWHLAIQDNGGGYEEIFAAGNFGSGVPGFIINQDFAGGTGAQCIIGPIGTADRNGMATSLISGSGVGTNKNGGDFRTVLGDPTGSGTRGKFWWTESNGSAYTTVYAQLDSAAYILHVPLFSWDAAVSAPIIRQVGAADATGEDLLVQGQGNNSATLAAGKLLARGGLNGGAGGHGAFLAQTPDGNTVLEVSGSSGSEAFGAFGVTAVTRPSAYTQTYSTATKTHANPTAAALTDSTTGTPSQTINDVGASFSQSTLNDNFASLTDEVEKNRADILNIKQVVNAMIDDDQALGWKQ